MTDHKRKEKFLIRFDKGEISVKFHFWLLRVPFYFFLKVYMGKKIFFFFHLHMPFRLRGKQLSLTYPRCKLTKIEAAQLLRDKFKELGLVIKGMLIVQESHALPSSEKSMKHLSSDEDVPLLNALTSDVARSAPCHLHVLILLSTALRTRNARCVDIAGYHGDYTATRSLKRWLKYLEKEDTSPYVEGVDLRESIGSVGKFDSVAMRILSGDSIMDMVRTEPGFCLQNLQRIRQFQTQTRAMRWEPEPEPTLNWNLNPQDRRIMRWLGMNLQTKRLFKTLQLYIHGPPNHGKTTLIMHLQKYLRIYRPIRSSEYFDGYSDQDFDLIVFDEFNGDYIKFSILKVLLDGQTVLLNQKFGSVEKKINQPIIILANHPPLSNFKTLSPVDEEAFLCRLYVVEVDTFIQCFQ